MPRRPKLVNLPVYKGSAEAVPRGDSARRWMWKAAVTIVAACLLAGCGGTSEKPWTLTGDASQRVTLNHDGWSLRLAGALPKHGTLRMSLSNTDRANADALDALTLDANVDAGHPVHLSISGAELGPSGAVIHRVLDHALPKGSRATLAYFDAAHSAWRAVPSTLSADRRTLTARVHHFSVWDDIEYAGGWLLDTRAGAPKCTGRPPDWVDDVTFLDDKNGPMRWCVGRDPKDASLVVVKVVVNRSYGVAIRTAVKPTWTYDSLFGGGPDALLSQLLADAPSAPASLRGPFGGRLPLMPGLEADFGFSEEQVRAANGGPLVTAERDGNAAVAGLTYSLLTKVAGNEGNVGRQVAAVTALLAIAQCEGDLGRALKKRDWAGLAMGAESYLTSNSDTVTNLLATTLPKVLPKADPKVLGKVAGKVGGKLWQVWAAGAFYKLSTWALDQKLLKNAYELYVHPKIIRHDPPPHPVPPPTVATTSTPTPSDGVPRCSEWVQMGNEDGDAALQEMADSHGDHSGLGLLRLSVGAFCKLYPGRTIDGVYSPRSAAPSDGGTGPIPTCADWEQMNNADADAALLRAARLRHDPNPDIGTLRLSAGVYCRLYPGRTIDGIYSG